MNNVSRLAFAICAALPGVSTATVTASAVVQRIEWTAIDLDSDESTVASFALTVPTAFSYVQATTAGDVRSLGQQTANVGQGAATTLLDSSYQAKANASFSSGAASVTESSAASSTHLVAVASSGAPLFTIAPQTKIQIKASVELRVKADEACLSPDTCTPAWARFTLSNAGWPSISLDQQITREQGGDDQTFTFDWQGEVANAASYAKNEYLIWTLSAGVGEPLSTVPEPSTAALSLLGVIAIGSVLSRHQKNKALPTAG